MKRVLLIHTDGNTFNNPTLKCVVDLLLENKVQLTIRYPLNLASMPDITELSLLPFGKLYQKVKRIIFDRLCWQWLSYLSVWFEYKFIYDHYDLVIGVDRQGLIEAAFLYKLSKMPFVFFSFEIMFESETSTKFKSSEKEAAKSVKHWFVQDEIRATHLQRENGLNPTIKTIIPLAPSGSSNKNSHRLRDQLGIPLEKKVAIVMGSISAWSMTLEILSSVESWPDDWALIVHDRYGRTEIELEKLGCNINGITAGKVYLSNHACILVDDMSTILAGVSAGLAFYQPDYTSRYTGKNLEFLGLASGKISVFLRHGIPFIMNEIGTYSSLAKQYNFGIVVDEPIDISSALPNFSNPSWGENAKKFYTSNLDFINYRDLIWEKLLEAEKNH